MHTLKLIGGTGGGKTEFTTLFTTPEARIILSKSVGRTNSTLKKRLLVYSTEYTNKMIIAVKLNNECLEREFLKDIFSHSIAEVIKLQGKVKSNGNNLSLKQFLEEKVNNTNNTKAILSLLTEESKQQLVNDLVNLYEESMMICTALTCLGKPLRGIGISILMNGILLGVKSYLTDM